MKLNKKLLVFGLTLAMLVGLFTVAAFAASGAAKAADSGLAFTYQVDDGEVQYVASLGSPEADGENFHALLNDKTNVKIVMYSDIVLTKGVLFGTMNDPNSAGKVVGLKASGNVDWDLNGHKVTIDANATAITVMMNSNDSYNNFPALHYIGSTYTLKLYSSVPGGEYVNLSSHSVFGVDKYRTTSYLLGTNDKNVCGGNNLTVNTVGALIRGYEADNGNSSPMKAHLYINGGTYIYSGSDAFARIGSTNVVKNATIVTTGAAKTVFLNHYWKSANLTVENVTVVAKNNATLLAASGDTTAPGTTGLNAAHTLTFKNVALIGKGLKPAYNVNTSGKLTYTATDILTNDADIFAFVYPTAPSGKTKQSFAFSVPAADGSTETVMVDAYVAADQLYTVTYSGANVTKTYLVGWGFAPLAMDPSYYEIAVDLAKGTANIPVAWADVPAAGVLDAAYGGQTVTVAPADNILAIAYALVENEAVTAYALADAPDIGAALVADVAAQANAGKLYIYQDIALAEDMYVVEELTVELAGHVLTVKANCPIVVQSEAVLEINGGEIDASYGELFYLYGKTTLNNVKILSDAYFVFNGQMTEKLYLNDVTIVNLYDGAAYLAGAFEAEINNAKIAGAILESNATIVGGEVFATEAFDGAKFADGVYGDLIVNNKEEILTVVGKSVVAAYAAAATTDAAKAIEIVYVFDNVVRGTQNYYYGSVASFRSEFADGYYFSYDGVSVLTKSATVACAFHADESKLKAQISLTDALNYTFYLHVEDAGVLANLALNGVALDFADLEQKEFDGEKFYVIPVAFESFADALNDYEISVDLVGAETSLTITAIVALDEYLAEVLATADEADAKIAYAVAEYVDALVTYFDYDFAFGDVRMKNLGRISNLLADYADYAVELPALPEKSELASDYVKGALLVANEKITFAFRFDNDFAGAVEIGGVAVDLAKPFDGFDRTYVLSEVAFADLDEVITITVKDAEGAVLETMTYSLADYIAGVVAQNEGVAADYAKALWKLSAVIG